MVIRSFLPSLNITSRFTLYYPFLILLNKLLSCSAFIVSETVCSDVLVFSAITRYVIINSFSLLIFSIMKIFTLFFWFFIISLLSYMYMRLILLQLASLYLFIIYYFIIFLSFYFFYNLLSYLYS